MTREVEYGIKVVAEDALSAPAAKIHAALDRLEGVLEDVESQARDTGKALQQQLPGATDKSAQAISALTRHLQRLPGLNDAWSTSVRSATAQIQAMQKAGQIGDVGGLVSSFSPEVIGEAMKQVEAFERKRVDLAEETTQRVESIQARASGSMLSQLRAGISLSGMLTAAAGAIAAVTVAAAAMVSAVSRGVSVMFELAEAASKVEQLEIRTAAAIRSRTTLTDDEFAALQKLNAERERQLGIDADAQLQAQGTLAAMGVRKEALDLATKATIGLSNATGQGLNEAARVVAKVLGGNIAALQEYGMKVSSVSEAQDKFAGLFEIVAAKSGTYQTKVESLRHSWDGLGEAFGKLVISSPEVKRVLDAIQQGILSLTKSTEQGSKSAKGYGQIIATVFRLIGTSAQASASLISNSIKTLNFFWRSPNLMRLAKDLDRSIVEMENVLAGGTGREVETANLNAAQSYVEAAKALAFYKREQQAAVQAEDVDAILAINKAIAEQTGKIRSLQEWAAKSQGGLRGLMSAVEELGREEVAKAAPPAEAAGGGGGGNDAAKKAAEELSDQRRRSEEADADMMLEITEWVVKQRNAAIESGLKKEQESREQALKQANDIERVKLEATRARLQAQEEAERAAQAMAEERTRYLQGRLEAIGMQMVDLFSSAFSQIGRLQNETVTEIVRNEQGMLEERTRITDQYVMSATQAMGKFLSDVAMMIYKSAINEIAMIAVRAAATTLLQSIKEFGLIGIAIGAALAGGVFAMVKSQANRAPPPQKFFTGGVVPGQMGVPRLAVVEGGERVTSVADRVDGRGGSGGSIVINNNSLITPSRVQMERTNRDAIIPSMRRLQRLGFGT